MIRLEFEYIIPFEVTKAGARVAADATPTAVLYRNGSASGVTVTVTATAVAGLYHATFTTPAGWSTSDRLSLDGSATIDTVAYGSIVWDSACEALPIVDANVMRVLGGTAVINTDVAKESSVQTLLGRVTEAAGDLWVRLATMIENVGGWRWTAKAVEEVSGVGAGSIRIPFKFQLADTTGVASVKVSIPGTGAINYSGTDGTTFLMVDPSATYSVRVTPPAAYQAVADFNVVVGTTDPAEQVVTLVPVAAVVPVDAPFINVVLPVIDQRGIALPKTIVDFTFTSYQAGATKTAVVMNPLRQVTSDDDGMASIQLLRLANYTAKYRVQTGDIRTITFATPDAGSLVVVEP